MAKRGRLWEELILKNSQELDFGHVKFEISPRYSRGDVSLICDYITWKSGENFRLEVNSSR